MEKILVIGSCGAGKSTLAKGISEKLNIPLIALDRLYWQPGWVRTGFPLVMLLLSLK